VTIVLHHVALETNLRQVEEELAFWALLGFEPVRPPGPLAERAAWVERGGTQIHLLYKEDPRVPTEGHTAVVVDDFGRTFEALRPFSPERRAEHWGAARAFVRSPAGHRVEFMAAPPP
jgi:catechol 2,3-dioxygenase-like lactoylglutathione lyase family enzyme